MTCSSDVQERPDGLQEYRRRIDALDSLLVRTLAERLDMCAEVARFKKAHGIPMMQPQRVDEVKERAVAGGVGAGLSRAFVYELYSRIIGEACRIENQLIDPTRAEGTWRVQAPREPGRRVRGPKLFTRVTILGGAGAVGGLLARALRDRVEHVNGIDVRPAPDAGVFDAFVVTDARDPSQAARALVKRSDCVVVATPLDVALGALPTLISIMRPAALLVDTLSVKSPVATALESAGSRCEWLSINPMFAPAIGFNGQNVIVVGAVREKRGARLVAAIESWGAQVHPMSAEQHDRCCAIVQAATHFVVLSLGALLEGQRDAIAATIAASSPPHQVCLALLTRILDASADVPWEIQVANPYASDVRHTLLTRASALHALIERQDRDHFDQQLTSMRGALGSHFESLASLSEALVRATSQRRVDAASRGHTTRSHGHVSCAEPR